MVRQKEDTMGRKKPGLIALAVLMLAISACTADSASKAGGDEPPMVLTMGTSDYPGRPAAEQIEHFAARVAELSGGTIQIEPQWEAAGRNTPDWDQVVARQVTSGELDMGNIPSRAWDTEGVNSLRVLNAPFLITSDELVDEVVSSDLADEMLSGLEEAGVVGLGLLPEGLRHPFGLGSALLGPEDYDGAVIRSPTSATVEAMFSALGASVTDGQVDQEIHAGMESGYQFDPQGSGTGNVAFFPKVNALVINAEIFDRLDDEQRGVLEQAAGETRQWSIETRASDTELAVGFCESGGSVVVADQTTLTALEAAVEPVYAELEADAQTRELIAAVRQMKQNVQVSASTPAPCGETGPTGESTEATGGGATADISAVNGTYRVEFTEEMFQAAGVPEAQYRPNLGVMTWTFDNGDFLFEENELVASYSVEGDLLTMTYTDGDVHTYRWDIDEAGDLHLVVVDVPNDWRAFDEVFTSQTWVRVGEVEASGSGSSADNDAINGVYRLDLSEERLRAGGVPQDQIQGNAGIWTNTMEDGIYSDQDGVQGTYVINGDQLTMSFIDGGVVSGISTYRWQLNENGDLLLEVVETPPEWEAYDKVWTAEPWARVEDIEPEEFPQGSFRVEHTVESLMAAGVSESLAHNHRGLWTLGFDKGVFVIEDTLGGRCDGGSYTVEDGRVSVRFGPGSACGDAANEVLFTAAWSLDGEELRFEELTSVLYGEADQALLEVLFASTPLVRVD
jgi:TRAP-type C4-dicarboxylate transport system substrate-binding protein